jgi:hypothetical protein
MEPFNKMEQRKLLRVMEGMNLVGSQKTKLSPRGDHPCRRRGHHENIRRHLTIPLGNILGDGGITVTYFAAYNIYLFFLRWLRPGYP